MAWRVAESLGATKTAGLLGEINASAPERDTGSDGSIGDEAHSSRSSDHNPCSCHRVVCARDFTHDPDGGFDSYEFAEWLRLRVLSDEPRVKYVISNRRIFSGQGQDYPVGVWRPYNGSNPHSKHVHVSVRHGAEYFDETMPWGWLKDVEPVPPPPVQFVPPARPVPEEFPAEAPAFPLPSGHWYGPESADSKNHSGFYAGDRPWVRYLVLLLKGRGWAYVEDGDTYLRAFEKQVLSFQLYAGISDDGLIGPETFKMLHAYKGEPQ